jgi:hypothetical protein
MLYLKCMLHYHCVYRFVSDALAGGYTCDANANVNATTSPTGLNMCLAPLHTTTEFTKVGPINVQLYSHKYIVVLPAYMLYNSISCCIGLRQRLQSACVVIYCELYAISIVRLVSVH